jgi:hypothetical protein
MHLAGPTIGRGRWRVAGWFLCIPGTAICMPQCGVQPDAAAVRPMVSCAADRPRAGAEDDAWLSRPYVQAVGRPRFWALRNTATSRPCARVTRSASRARDVVHACDKESTVCRRLLVAALIE